MLPNGNSLLTSGRWGYTFELTPDNEIVWEYKTPIIGGAAATQGDTLAINNNLTFRMKRYPLTYPAFEDKDLTGNSWIELEPDTTFCALILPASEVLNESAYKIFPNPTNNQLTIEWDGMFHADIEIFNMMGHRIVHFPKCSGGRKYLDTSKFDNGMYLSLIHI